MPRRDVRDLVSQDTCQLVFGVDALEHSARDVNVATRQRHGVDHRRINDCEMPRQIRAIGSRRDAVTDGVNKTIELRLLIVDAELPDHLLVRLLPDLDLLTLGDDVELALVRDRIGGASGQEQGRYAEASHASARCKEVAGRCGLRSV